MTTYSSSEHRAVGAFRAAWEILNDKRLTHCARFLQSGTRYGQARRVGKAPASDAMRQALPSLLAHAKDCMTPRPHTCPTTDPRPIRDAFRFLVKPDHQLRRPCRSDLGMHQELVERKRWISERRFLHALNYCMLLRARKRSNSRHTSAGFCTRTWGGLSGRLFVLSFAFILLALTYIYIVYGGCRSSPNLLRHQAAVLRSYVRGLSHGSRALQNACCGRSPQRLSSVSSRCTCPFRSSCSAPPSSARSAAKLRLTSSRRAADTGRRSRTTVRRSSTTTHRSRPTRFSRGRSSRCMWPSGSRCGRSRSGRSRGATAGQHAHADRLVLHQSGSAHFRRAYAVLRTSTRAVSEETGGSRAQMIDGLALSARRRRSAQHGRRFRSAFSARGQGGVRPRACCSPVRGAASRRSLHSCRRFCSS